MNYVDVETTTFDPWVPNFSSWRAGKYLQEETDEVEDEIQPYQTMTCPKHRIAFFKRHKYSQALKYDGKFDEEDNETIHCHSESYILELHFYQFHSESMKLTYI